MFFWKMMKSKPYISVIINFYNMQREAKRTLYSLTTPYQRDINADDYEVIAIDNSSTSKLDERWIQSLGKNFRYIYFGAQFPSPCAALNYGVKQARSNKVICCIDGARILSPGILKYILSAFRLHENPFIYTLGMHLGDKLQNNAIKEGYNRQIEDKLLSTVDWKNNGYELFKISTLAASSKGGYFSPIDESNCFSMTKSDFLSIGGFDESFTSPGCGLANLDIFNKAHENNMLFHVFLLGEATFHQIHGGVATNVPIEQHPLIEMQNEYANIRGRMFESFFRTPVYYGSLSKEYHEKLF